MFRSYCIRQFLCVGILFFLYQGIGFAQERAASTYWDCLGTENFSACVEAGPLSAKLAGDLRRELDEAEAKIAAGGDEGQWALYSIRFVERRFLDRVQQSFDLTRRPPESLPVAVREAIDQLAVRIARLTNGAPDPALESVWSPATRAELAARLAPKAAAVAAAAAPDESAVIGQRFVQVFSHAREMAEVARRPVSAGQYARIGDFQRQATECLIDARDPARAVEIHNELAAWRDELLARGEEVSPDLHTLQNDLLHGLLEAGA